MATMVLIRRSGSWRARLRLKVIIIMLNLKTKECTYHGHASVSSYRLHYAALTLYISQTQNTSRHYHSNTNCHKPTFSSTLQNPPVNKD
eukprot:6200392-Pleurochrysis_carterae.AAC.3